MIQPVPCRAAGLGPSDPRDIGVTQTTLLLQPGDPAPFGVENADGPSPILFVSDHAGRAIPLRLGTLGLDEAERARHISYDIGIYGVTTALAREMGAEYIFQPYSRLVIDCNRRPGLPQSVPLRSDGTVVPGNADLTEAARRAREVEILAPYQDQIDRTLRHRKAAGRPVALFAMHSCTDRLRSDPRPRPWQISVIAHRDWRLGTVLVDILRQGTDLNVGVNEPYVVDMAADYTVPVHAEATGLPYVEIEIRQDLIGDAGAQAAWARLLQPLFARAVAVALAAR